MGLQDSKNEIRLNVSNRLEELVMHERTLGGDRAGWENHHIMTSGVREREKEELMVMFGM